MLSWLAPPGLEAATIAALLAASFGTSFITVAFGIGGGAALLGIMAALVPPAVLIPVHGVVQAGSNLGRALMTLRHAFWPAAPAFVAGSIIGAGFGGLVAVNLPPALVQIGVGLFIVWSVLAPPPRMLHAWPFAIGTVSTFLTMFFGATGPFVAAFTKSLALGRHAHVATHAVLMSVQHAIKTLAFGLLGFAFGPWLGFCVAMIAAGFAGTLAGGYALDRMNDARFKLALNAVLLLIAARLLWAGGMELLAAS